MPQQASSAPERPQEATNQEIPRPCSTPLPSVSSRECGSPRIPTAMRLSRQRATVELMSSESGSKQHRVAVSQLAGFGDEPALPNGKLTRPAKLLRQPLGAAPAHTATAEDVGYSHEFFSRGAAGALDRTVDRLVITPVDHAAASAFGELRRGATSISQIDREALEAYAGILTLRNQETRRQLDFAAARHGGRLSDDEKVTVIGNLASKFAKALRFQLLSIVRFEDDLLVLGDTGYGMTRTDLDQLSADATRREGRPMVVTAHLGDRLVGSTRFVLPLSPRLAVVWQPQFLGALPPVGTAELASAFNVASIADSEREFYSSLARPLDTLPGLPHLPQAERFSRFRRAE